MNRQNLILRRRGTYIIEHRVTEFVETCDFYSHAVGTLGIVLLEFIVDCGPVAALDRRIDVPTVDPDMLGTVAGALSGSTFVGGRPLNVPCGETKKIAAFAGIMKVDGSG